MRMLGLTKLGVLAPFVLVSCKKLAGKVWSPLRLLAALNCKKVSSETPPKPPRSSDERSCQVQ